MYIESSGKPTPRVADTDIRCYKLFFHVFDGDDEFFTSPVRHVNYPRTGTIGSAEGFGETDIVVEGTGWSNAVYSVKYGLHSFVNGESAVKIADDGLRRAYGARLNVIVVECVIPKGTRYFEGRNDRGFRNFVSERLEITDKWVYNKTVNDD